MVMRGLAGVLLIGFVSAGCGDDGPMLDADAGPPRCVTDVDCSDGVFCNGAERCAPAAGDSDARGCVPGPAPCTDMETCDEVTLCAPACEVEPDADGDGVVTIACGGVDCDDDDPNRYPGNPELCDAEGHDEDCDPTTFGYRDIDGDGSADDACCNTAEDGERFCGDDCDDLRRTVNPSTSEVCDGFDNDCDENLDEGVELARYVDEDGDGFGDATRASVGSCVDMEGFSPFPTDCDDDDADVFPGALEACDGKDTNCDGIEEDVDGDGHVSEDGLCAPVEGGLPRDDCDDADAATFGGAEELCDGVDRDCDGVIDERASADASCSATVAGGRSFCAAGDCQLAACDPGLEDCNRDISDGCETPTTADPVNCGGCGIRCAPGASCRRGLCESRGAVELDFTIFNGCVRYGDDTMSCWGSNPIVYGVTPVPAMQWPTTQELVPLTGVTGFGVGPFAACALRSGELYCWGYSDGHIGLGVGAFEGPQRVGTFTDVVQVSLGWTVGCILRATGELLCAGSNGDGEVGDGTRIRRTAFVPIATGVRSVDVGDHHACYVRDSDGQVFCWGRNRAGEAGRPPGAILSPVAVAGLDGVERVAAGPGTTCALRPPEVLCWGDNSYGELGRGFEGGYDPSPGPVPALTGTPIRDISGTGPFCVVTDAGTALCWGDNAAGIVGDGTFINRPEPVPVQNLGPVVSIASGSCALRASGSVACWGEGIGFRLGNGASDSAPLPTEVVGLSSVHEVVVGSTASCARTNAGAVWCWGGNEAGELGDGSAVFGSDLAREAIVSDVTQLSNGNRFSCALIDDGTVECWGVGDRGQLGSGPVGASNVPIPVTGLSGTAIAVTTGDLHACALLDDGRVACWGDNQRQQLGLTGIALRASAAIVPSLGDVVEIAAGAYFTCARHADGRASCWGADPGVGVRAPGYVTGVSEAIGLVAMAETACVLSADHRLRCWGGNYTAQFGNGSDMSVATPGVGVALPAYGQVVGGSHHALYRHDTGVLSWGLNGQGQLGLDSMRNIVSRPQAVVLDDVDVVGAGSSARTTCALTAGRLIYCWGSNDWGQVGPGATSGVERAPIRVPGF